MKIFTIKKIYFTLLIALLGLFPAQTTLAQCNPDNTPPTCIAPPDTVLSCQAFQALNIENPGDAAALSQYFGDATAADNCPGVFTQVEIQVLEWFCNSGRIKRKFTAIDLAGLTSTATQIIDVLPDSSFTLHLPEFFFPNDPELDTLSYDATGCNLLSVAYADVRFDLNCDSIIDRVERTWSTIDWCNTDLDGEIFEAPALDLNGDGIIGDAYSLRISNDSIFRIYPGMADSLLGHLDRQINYTQVILYEAVEATQLNLTGTVYFDELEDCTFGSGETGLSGYTVLVDALPSGQVYQTTTDALGAYELSLCSSDTFFTAHLALPFDYAGSCASSYELELAPGTLDTVLNLPVQLPAACAQLLIDVGAPGLRPCMSSPYSVNYFNYSFDTINDVSIRLILDPLFDFLGSDIPPSSVNGDTLHFPIGTLAPLESGTFSLGILLDCETPLGQTHCVQANIYPDTICVPLDPNWSGASVALSGACQGDSLAFRVVNDGLGNMQQVQNYIVIEDVLMLMNEPFQLDVGAELMFKVPANGATWHVRADQVPNHPGLDMPIVTIEGCGGLNNPGQALAYPQNDGDPFVSIDCQQNVNSYDPNDIQVFPNGVGEEHLVEANTDLEYMIRFQNTGTAPAIKVVLLDTLPQTLDVDALQIGVSSHDFVFEQLEEGRVLRFTFNDIYLPDSSSNLEESQGFIKFKIKQKPDLAIGTQIDNSAAIYFDFNDPILTNIATVKIGEDLFDTPVIIATENIEAESSLNIYPNPARDQVMVSLPKGKMAEGQIMLYNHLQQIVRTQSLNGPQTDLSVKGLPAGIYYLKTTDRNGLLLGSAKLIVH